ncbi:MAG: ATP-dependent DNA helicase [Stagnimonas sp.]|nr:ATP-dependent DNA helicase [Stagnimonas sp.]
MSVADIEALFAEGGTLTQAIPGFVPRAAQQQMAAAVAQAFESGENLIVEAGTGTGKTFAYLAPALKSGKRVVISTGTKNLQDQLFGRDLPRLREALGTRLRVSLLKGRSNYLCLHRMHKARQDVRARQAWARLAEIEQWSRDTPNGELSDMPGEAPDETFAARISSTADNCLGSKCPDFADCFVVKARRAAAAADLVVVNHALLFADHIIRQEGFRVLPGADAVVIDEAHQLPEMALRHFGQRVSTQQLQALARDTASEVDKWNDTPDLTLALTELVEATARLEAQFASGGLRERLREFHGRFGVADTVLLLGEKIDTVVQCLKPLEERTAEFSGCLERALKLQERWYVVSDNDTRDQQVRWVEPIGRGGALNATPLEVAKPFAEMRAAHPGAWIFTSATLAAGKDFQHFSGPLGLSGTPELKLDSPFDYATQARLWLPPNLPEPNDPAYTGACAAAMRPVIDASGGGAFVLCTSHRALQSYAGLLRNALPHLPVLAQNDFPKAELLRRFVEAGNAVLVATASFWEGVDVKGHALRLVIIDKLPFAAPGDPVLDAKLDAIKQAGGNPFNDDQLPRAIVTLRQGVGRLIRDETDRGLLMLCDPRLKSKSYGRKVLASLPPMPVLGTLAETESWMRLIRPI